MQTDSRRNKILLLSTSWECGERTPIDAIQTLVQQHLGMEVVFSDSLLAESYSPVLPADKQEHAGKFAYHHVGRPEDRANQFVGIDWES